MGCAPNLLLVVPAFYDRCHVLTLNVNVGSSAPFLRIRETRLEPRQRKTQDPMPLKRITAPCILAITGDALCSAYQSHPPCPSLINVRAQEQLAAHDGKIFTSFELDLYCAARIDCYVALYEGLRTNRRRSAVGVPCTFQVHVLPAVDTRAGFQFPVSNFCRTTGISYPSLYSLKICTIAQGYLRAPCA